MRLLMPLAALALGACFTSQSASPSPAAERRARPTDVCVARWLALDAARRDVLLEFAFDLLGQYELEFERAQRLTARWLDRERRPVPLTARCLDSLDHAHLRLSDPELRGRLAWNSERWREGHPLATPSPDAALQQRIEELATLTHFEAAAHELAGQHFDAELAFAALFDARLAQFEHELEHPPPRHTFCLLPEDLAELQAHPFVHRGGLALGPSLTPVVLDFLERLEAELSR